MREIIHCITTISLGGAEKQLHTLVEQQVKSGASVTIFFLKDQPDLQQKLEEIGATVLDYLACKNFLSQIYILRKYLKNKKAILHAHLPRSELVCAFSKQQSCLIISKHNSERFFPKGNSFFSKILARFVFFKSNMCICISIAVKNFLIEINEIKNSDKVQVVHYGYSKLGEACIANQNAKSSLGLKNFFIIGTIARLVPQKNYEVLLEAFSLFRINRINVKLLIVGSGDQQKYIFNLAKKLDIYEDIIWVPSTRDVYIYLSAMDIFVLASKYEGFGLVLLEAMQSQTPIIAAKNSSIPEVLGSHYPGFFETTNVLDLLGKVTMATDQRYCKKLTSFYPDRLHFFDPTQMSEKIFSCYEKAISSQT